MDPPGLARGQFLLSESQYVSLCVVYVAEESKVRTEDPKCSSGSLNKRGATRVARFLHWIFKEQVCPQSGESSLLRWFWSFIGLSQAVADCISCHRGGGAAIWATGGPQASLPQERNRKFRQAKDPVDAARCGGPLTAFQFPHHFL